MLIEKILIIVSTLLLLIIIGCSSGGNSPIINESTGNPTIVSALMPVGVSDWNRDGSALAGMGALGMFNLHVEPDSVTAELTSLRNGALTDVLEVVDITNFLTLAPCFDCAKIKSVSLDADNHLVISIGIKHPFDAGDMLKPISGRNRADLHVFNIEGIVVSNSVGTIFSLSGETSAGFFLLNADSYTGYLDSQLDGIYETSATIHPYITHFDDYSVGNFNPSNQTGFESVVDPPPSGNLVMAMGCDYDYQDYVFDLDEQVDFIFTVGCTYAVSAEKKNMRFTPEYRIPQHNKKAASEVSVVFITNELRGGITTSAAEIEIHVVDINHGVAVGEPLDEMFADSSVDDIFIDIPEVMTSQVVIDGNNAISGTGHDPSDPLVYAATIENTASAEMGTYPGLVSVNDNYPPGQNGNPLLNGMDGIKRVDPIATSLEGLFHIDKFAAYQVFMVDVAQGCGPITGSITTPTCPVSGVTSGQMINFEASASSANGGEPVVLYEWDIDYDGVDFDIDATGASVTLGPFINPNCGTPPEDPVTYTVAVRGTDSCDPPNVTVFDTCEITVDTCTDPYKNIPLRDGVEAWDLSVDSQNGRVLIIYSDGEVWQYLPSDSYQVPNPSTYYYDSDWFNTYIQGGYSCVPDKAYIAFSDNSSFIMGYFMYINDWVDRAWYNIIDDTGSEISHIVPTGIWSWSYSLWGVYAWGSNGGAFANHMGSLSGVSVPDTVWFSHSGPGNNYSTEFFAYIMSAPRSGINRLWPGWVRGIQIDSSGSGIWCLEYNELADEDSYCARFQIAPGTYGTINYDNAYFGTGTGTDADNGFYDPRDMARDDDNLMIVLDELSSGDYRLKAFDVSSSPGTSAGAMDITGLTGPLNKMDSGDWLDPTDGNMLFILHGDDTEGFYLSIFRESELSW